MHFSSLNDDVMFSIISAMDKSTVWSFSTTCRAAHDASLPALLSSIRLKSSVVQIIGFCEYFLCHTERIQLLRRLEIDVGFSEAEAPDTESSDEEFYDEIKDFPFSRSLANILMQAHNLAHLCLRSSEALLGAEPDIVNAIIQCPHLTALDFSDHGILSHNVIREKRGLRKLAFSFFNDVGSITPLIKRSQPSLEVLSIKSYSNLDTCPALTLDGKECWPRLRELDFIGCHRMSTRTLTSAFPNLRVLQFPASFGNTSSHMRMLNEQDLSSWHTLDHVVGSVADVYDLALSSQVRELCFPDQFGGTISTAEKENFLDIVQRTTPLVLIFGAGLGVFNESFCHRFAQYASRLQYLEIRLEKNGFFHTFDPQVRTLSCHA
jgi:hypothetical protein